MNSQLTFAIAQSRQQDLLAAAQRTDDVAGLSTGSSIIRRLRDSALTARPKHSTPHQSHTDSPVAV
jgi:hypothetical protein